MASRSTRSSGRRSEGLVTTKNGHNITNKKTRHVTSSNQLHLDVKPEANTSRKKRPHEDEAKTAQPSPPVKKARYAVEIESRPMILHTARPPLLHKSPTIVVVPVGSASQPRQSYPHHTTETTDASDLASTTTHHQKVVNGIKHELDRLKPCEVVTKDERRKLRSQEGTRFKSELSLYFPEYDEVIGNDAKEDHILNIDTPILVVDCAKPLPTATQQILGGARSANSQKSEYPLKQYNDALFTTLSDSQRVDFSFLDSHCKDTDANPLPDSFYEVVHKKPERHERVIRNTDKGRAQHERDQVIRLLDGLQGHEWLKLMGVSGITDSRKKDFEPAREHFIQGCLAIIGKFKIWRDEEKRRRAEKEQQAADAADVEAGAEEIKLETEQVQNEEDVGNISDGDPPDYSDVDASAARQLHEEAVARSAPITAQKRSKIKTEQPLSIVRGIDKEFKSFFPKSYLREAALHKHRRSSRSVSAWGQPIPEVQQVDFDLPEGYRDEEFLRVYARKKRRERRNSKE